MEPCIQDHLNGIWLGSTTAHRQTWLFSVPHQRITQPGRRWRRPPGRPRNKWLDQLRNDSTRPVGMETSGGVLSTVDLDMVVQRRDGPRPLRDDDYEGKKESDGLSNKPFLI